MAKIIAEQTATGSTDFVEIAPGIRFRMKPEQNEDGMALDDDPRAGHPENRRGVGRSVSELLRLPTCTSFSFSKTSLLNDKRDTCVC